MQGSGLTKVAVMQWFSRLASADTTATMPALCNESFTGPLAATKAEDLLRKG